MGSLFQHINSSAAGIPSAAVVPWAVVIVASLVAAVWDLKTRRIPNVLCGIVFIGGVIWAGGMAGPIGVLSGLAGAVVLFAPCFVLFVLGAGGAGDAKLMASVGVWLGIRQSLLTLACVSATTVVACILYAVLRHRLKPIFGNMWWIVQWLGFRLQTGSRDMVHPGDVIQVHRMPYGVVIFAGICITAAGKYLWTI